MIEKLKHLKKLRELEADAKAKRDKIIEALPIVIELQLIREAKELNENLIRTEAISKYNLTGEKKFGQVGIRITTNYMYTEENALNWAKEHDLCLALDKTAFKKQLKVQLLEFVQTEEVPTATIPTQIKEELFDVEKYVTPSADSPVNKIGEVA